VPSRTVAGAARDNRITGITNEETAKGAAHGLAGCRCTINESPPASDYALSSDELSHTVVAD
jgi:hypothetical protein